MAYDYNAELQALYDEKFASFRAASAEGSIPDLTISLPRGMSDHEIEQSERGAWFSFARNTGKSEDEIELYFGG